MSLVKQKFQISAARTQTSCFSIIRYKTPIQIKLNSFIAVKMDESQSMYCEIIPDQTNSQQRKDFIIKVG